MNGACSVKLFFWPGALGRGQKVKYHLISITKSISKIFTPNFVCVLTNEKNPYQMGFSFCCLGHAPGTGLLGVWGGGRQFFFKHGHVSYQIDGMMSRHNARGGTGGVKNLNVGTLITQH